MCASNCLVGFTKILICIVYLSFTVLAWHLLTDLFLYFQARNQGHYAGRGTYAFVCCCYSFLFKTNSYDWSRESFLMRHNKNKRFCIVLWMDPHWLWSAGSGFRRENRSSLKKMWRNFMFWSGGFTCSLDVCWDSGDKALQFLNRKIDFSNQ